MAILDTRLGENGSHITAPDRVSGTESDQF